ncbi:arginine--tRNA ligase [Candidatus Roizmanbacteria bacterium RIFCSPHIGHO2_01_FULL_37_16b]|nr:MAG: arginine--tRNA ligase [Candidatus Roizmanbacteria bacterium RIFCSPHIGHO2_01_FULL_37_16b]
MIKEKLLKNLGVVLKKIGVEEKEINLEHSANPNFGDYATSIALKLAKTLNKNPFQIAEEIKKNFSKNNFIEKIEVVKPGFINFWINTNYFLNYARKITQEIFDFPSFHLGKNKKIMIEFAHPNTHKLFHIGHLRNISSGEAICRILQAVGNNVIRANYQGDVGLHIAKCVYKLKSQSASWRTKIENLKTLHGKIEFLGKMYAEGNKAYETDEIAKKEIIEINKMIYEQNGEVITLWKETRQWSLDYFDEIYKRVYTKFDRLYFESEMSNKGTQITKEALEKGILEKSEGAIVFNGKSYALDTRVFLNRLGIPTYEGKELALAEKEFSEFGEIDKCIHVVGPEQSSFFKVTFKVEELLNPKKYKGKQMHHIGGWVRLKQGKMSSRSGVVVEGPWLLDEAKKRILKDFKCDEDTAEAISVAAVKYSFLKNHISAEIAFDFDESISLEGNSGPYLLYTFVRTQSVLNKSTYHLGTTWINNGIAKLEKEERDLLRTLANYSETVYEAARNFSPNLIANYLYDLAQKYNLFYQKHKILLTEEKIRIFRLLLTKATGQVIKNGLYLLGIKTVNKM